MSIASTPDEAHHSQESTPPRLLDNGTLGFWIFLSAESVLFASLIGTYILLHTSTNGGPTPQSAFDIPLTFMNTMALLLSSLTMGIAYLQVQRQNFGGMRLWLGVTVLLGMVFLGGTIHEFMGFYKLGLTISSSPFGSAFFTVVGFHALHVTFGLFWLISMIVYSYKASFKAESVRKLGILSLYWHFVDVVWILIFTVIYLLAKAA